MEQLLNRYPKLKSVSSEILKAIDLLIKVYENDGKVLTCGNGGSASDSEHIAGELSKSFVRKRPLDEDYYIELQKYGDEGKELSNMLEKALPCMSLVNETALMTAFANDKNPNMVFAQGVNAFGKKGDILLTMSTSGNSKNCIYAAIAAKAKNMQVISITGENGGKLKNLSDVCINIPENETYLVQELTLPIYHYICLEIEKKFFK